MRRRASRSAGVYSRMSIEVWGELKKYMLRAKLRNGRRFAPSYFRRDPFDFAQGKEALRFHNEHGASQPAKHCRHPERSFARVWVSRALGGRETETKDLSWNKNVAACYIEERFLDRVCHPSQQTRRMAEKSRQTPLGMTIARGSGGQRGRLAPGTICRAPTNTAAGRL